MRRDSGKTPLASSGVVRDETPNGSARSLARRESSVREFVRSPDATEPDACAGHEACSETLVDRPRGSPPVAWPSSTETRVLGFFLLLISPAPALTSPVPIPPPLGNRSLGGSPVVSMAASGASSRVFPPTPTSATGPTRRPGTCSPTASSSSSSTTSPTLTFS